MLVVSVVVLVKMKIAVIENLLVSCRCACMPLERLELAPKGLGKNLDLSMLVLVSPPVLYLKSTAEAAVGIAVPLALHVAGLAKVFGIFALTCCAAVGTFLSASLQSL